MNGKINHFSQIAYIRRYTLTEGQENGLKIIEINNGKMRFLLNESKALDIMQLWHENSNISFVSKNGFSAREISFLRRFEGGMLYTCGLDSVGGRDGYELHGTLHNTPAQIVRAECDEKQMVVEATVKDSALFGQNLVLKRKISTAVNGDSVQIEDTLVNRGYKTENYCLLYHVNVGYPMLDSGAKIVADVKNVKARTDWANQNKPTMYEMSDDIPLQEECCYFLHLRKPKVALVNPKLGKKFTVEYSHQTFPHFVEWKSMASGDYALGLEPCTTELDDGFAYKAIAPDESIKFSVTLSVEKM